MVYRGGQYFSTLFEHLKHHGHFWRGGMVGGGWNASLSDDDAKGIAHPDQGGRHRPLAVREPVLGYLPHKTHTSGLKLKFTIIFCLNKKGHFRMFILTTGG